MPKKSASLGSWAFLIGAIIAILAGIAYVELPVWVATLLVVLGIVVGFLNVSARETKDFLLVAIVLVLLSYIGASSVLAEVAGVGKYIVGILGAIQVLVIPAAVVVALKAIWDIASEA